MTSAPPKTSPGDKLPKSLTLEVRDSVALLWLDRPEKRNALNDETVLGIERFLIECSDDIRAIVLLAVGDHFSAGLDLSEVTDLDMLAGIRHSRSWHRVFTLLEHGPAPVISVLKGAVIGGGLELAASTHIRIAERSAFYALPEGQHGIFVGGGASVRLPRLIGVARMSDMMLTGRRYDAEAGQTLGISQYLVEDGAGEELALALASKIASNSAATNFAIVQALPRIAELGPQEGLFFEAVTAAAVANASGEAKTRMTNFLTRNKKTTDDDSAVAEP